METGSESSGHLLEQVATRVSPHTSKSSQVAGKEVGDIVLMKNNPAKRNQWPMAIVVETLGSRTGS